MIIQKRSFLCRKKLITSTIILIISTITLIGFKVNAASWQDNIAYNWVNIGDATPRYNCLWYATETYKPGMSMMWEWAWGSSNPTLAEVKSYLKVGYGLDEISVSSSLKPNFDVFAYGTSSFITHFSRSNVTDTCTAKWGQEGVYSHIGYNPYKPYNSSTGAYGSVQARFRK